MASLSKKISQIHNTFLKIREKFQWDGHFVTIIFSLPRYWIFWRTKRGGGGGIAYSSQDWDEGQVCVFVQESNPLGEGEASTCYWHKSPYIPLYKIQMRKCIQTQTRIHKQTQIQIQKDGITKQVYFWAHINLGLNWVFLCSAHVKIQPNSHKHCL